MLDTQPKDDVVDFDSSLLIAAESAFIEKLREAAARLPEDVRQRMIEADCIGPEDVPDDDEEVPDDHGNDIDDATGIRVGADVRGAMDYDGDIDFFRFQAEQGQSYQIDVALGTLDDSIVELYDGDGAFLDTNDDYGDTLASRLYWNAPSSGERYIAVVGYGIGTYTLTVSLSDIIDDHANSDGDATAIRVGADVRGALDYDGDIDFFRFQAERGQSYQIDVALGTLDDSIVELYDADGSLLDINDDGERLFWEAPSSGERYVFVGGYGVGTYTLTVSLSDVIDDHANSEGDATAIRVGADVRGALDYDGDVDFFRFQAEQGQSYQIDVALGTLYDSIVDLYDGDGSFLDTNDDHGDTYASRLFWEAPSSGERYIAVVGSGIGTYTLTVSLSDFIDDHGNSEGDATGIRVGADVRGAMDYDGDIDFFRFQAEQGQSYQIDVALGTLDDSIVELYDGDGAFLDTNDDYGDTLASRLYWNAPSSGERYIAVVGYGIGTYTLTVSLSDIIDDHANSEGDATAIRVGADVRGALDYDGDIDFFRFQAERGQSYQIDVALGTLDDSIVELYDADGSLLDINDDGERLFWEAPSSGERYVFVGGYGVGTYTLTVSIVDDHGDTAEDGGSVASDRAALVALYNATEGGSWTTRTNWLSGRPLDEWHGVTTDSDGRVIALNFSSNHLEGALPAALGDLTNLESLRLLGNELTGPIPAALGDLTNLESLVLSNNELTGPIPAALGDLTNLESLRLGGNELTGPIPAALGDLTNLRALNLWSNELTGPIPAALGDLANLEFLWLGSNQLTGPIPAALGDLTNLRVLSLWSNELTGPIPAALGDLTNLESLWLRSNQLTGRIPAELSDLSNLRALNLWGNELTGRIPAALGDLTNLESLWLRSNQLTGPIPTELSNLSVFRQLYLSEATT